MSANLNKQGYRTRRTASFQAKAAIPHSSPKQIAEPHLSFRDTVGDERRHLASRCRGESRAASIDLLVNDLSAAAPKLSNPVLPFRRADRRVWVAGHRGMVGQALVRRLLREGCEILTVDRRTLDLRRQKETEDWLAANRPEVVILAAATVGGIFANNSRPAEFLYDNLLIAANVIEAARRGGEKALGARLVVHLPREHRSQCGRALLTGPWNRPTSATPWQDLRPQVVPGVSPPIRRRFHLRHADQPVRSGRQVRSGFRARRAGPDAENARSENAGRANGHRVGNGAAPREFLYADDCADALVHLARFYSGEEHINVGTGSDITIRELADRIQETVGYPGRFVYDESRPDGSPQKRLDVTRIEALGWRARTDLTTGLRQTYDWYQSQHEAARSKSRNSNLESGHSADHRIQKSRGRGSVPPAGMRPLGGACRIVNKVGPPACRYRITKQS